MFRSVQSPGHGGVRARADDIGAALSLRKGHREAARVFRIAEYLAGLTLKAAGCCVAPLGAALSGSLERDVR
eukprot:4511553-Pyramimonas_sp.AAC.1